ncbi:MAG: efflux RND transporter periplasmic adaptor subunit [Paracoccus hibiscisoli]|uniref:efflux RND transporter periplasmic adaptor subunit n=1 Tax=Paracoccus hibiscisoli TaxID=2023261 RepID=UPI00391A2028
MRSTKPLLLPLALSALLAGCIEDEAAKAETAQTPIRSVQTMVVEELPASLTRAFPTVLQPPQMTSLAFQMGGRLAAVDLQVSQRIAEGQVLLTLDAATIDLELRQAEAALGEAESGLDGAQEDASRQAALFARGVAARAALDWANRAKEQAFARVEQARRRVDLIAEARAETQLIAPFDAVVNTVEVQSFDTLQPGRVAVTIYPETNLQARILVSYEVVSQLVPGQGVALRPTDQRDRTLAAVVTEVADRAPAVSAFPVVVTLQEVSPSLRSGMAAEVLIDMAAGDGRGSMPVPVSALATHMTPSLDPVGPEGQHRAGRLFVYRDDGTLELRDVVLSGLDEARMIVVSGLEPGERVVTAGVPFLQAGQTVRLIGQAGAP